MQGWRSFSGKPEPGVGRRTVLGVGLSAITLPSGVACSRRTSELRATWWGDPGLNQAVRRAIAGFERRHDVRIGTEALPWDGYWDKLATQAAGRSEPDLIMQAGTYLPEYVPRHALRDLTEMVGTRDADTAAVIDLRALDPGVVEAGNYAEGTYAVIAAVNSPTVVYNATVLQRAGLQPPEDTWTWNEFADLAAEVSRALGTDGYGTTDGGGDLIAFQVWVRQRGRELFDENGELTVGEAELGEWLDYWRQLRSDGVAPPPAVTAESADDPTRSPVVRGIAAFMPGWNQDMIALDALTDDELGLAMMPEHENGAAGQWLNAASMWAVSARTTKPRLVARLIDHLVNDARAIDELQVWLGVPPSERARKRIRPGLSAAERASLDYIDRVEQRSRPLPRLWPQGFTELRDLLPRLNEDVGFGRRTVREAAERFFVEAGRALA